MLRIIRISLLCALLLSWTAVEARSRARSGAQPPHIIYILADDLGFNDVGFHGSAQIPTPNIDALAYSGIILNRHYVAPICTPSRAALMTGKYPIHTGMQHTVLYAAEPRGLPLEEKLLPQYLNDLGYTSHIAGKWHLGHYKHAYTPLFRGFSSHVGFWTGHQDYYDHTAVEHEMWGLDMRNGLDVAYKLHGQYSTDVITDYALKVISQHNSSAHGSLFLYVAHAAVHSGNPYNPLPANDDLLLKLSHIEHLKRRKYATLVSALDTSVGKIVQQLRSHNMLENSLIVFSTDNGGPAQGFNSNFASNYPLRGVKNTLWEGGVRGAALLWSPHLNKRQHVSEQTMHIVDWLPTLVEAAGGPAALANLSSRQLDGQSMWQALTNNSTSPRKSVLHNIDEIWGSSALTVGDWKLVNGTNYEGAWDGWYGPAGVRQPQLYDWARVAKSPAGQALAQLKMLPSKPDQQRLRATATVECAAQKKNEQKGTVCKPLEAPCLFNIRDDPCERYNLAEVYPKILSSLQIEMMYFHDTMVEPSNKRDDPRANPKFWNWTWTNFGDSHTYDNDVIMGDVTLFGQESWDIV